eukprot:675227-Amphidinium_carterae.1
MRGGLQEDRQALGVPSLQTPRQQTMRQPTTRRTRSFTKHVPGRQNAAGGKTSYAITISRGIDSAPQLNAAELIVQ